MSSERPWLESLVACLPDGVALVAADWTIVWANRELAAMIGETGALKGRDLSSIVEEFDGLSAVLVAEVKDTPRASRVVRLLRADKTSIDATLYLAACTKGVSAAWSLCLRPLGDADVLRRKLAARERSHSFLTSGTSDVILRADNDLNVTWANDAARTFYAEGEPLARRVSEETIQRLRELLATDAFAESKAEIEVESAANRAPFFYLRGFVRRIVDEHGAPVGISMILHDDSASRRVEVCATRFGLSPREAEVMEYVLQGYSNLNIATILGLSESGVKFHLRNILTAAKVANRTELLAVVLG